MIVTSEEFALSLIRKFTHEQRGFRFQHYVRNNGISKQHYFLILSDHDLHSDISLEQEEKILHQFGSRFPDNGLFFVDNNSEIMGLKPTHELDHGVIFKIPSVYLNR